MARAIGLGYPGGPKIDKLSKEGNPDAIVFPKAHIRGKKHMTRKMIKLEKNNLPAVPDSSMAMPSLLYRTKAITERVLSSNHDEPVANPRPVPKPFVFVPPELSATGEPLWRQKSMTLN